MEDAGPLLGHKPDGLGCGRCELGPYIYLEAQIAVRSRASGRHDNRFLAAGHVVGSRFAFFFFCFFYFLFYSFH
jgi:hypothetical protein